MKRRVALVVTGRLEYEGLPGALGRLFAGAEFFISGTVSKLELKDSTSARVDPARNARAASIGSEPVIDELIAHLAGSLYGPEEADYSLVVEDLELENRGNERNVVQAVHEAARRHTTRAVSRNLNVRLLTQKLSERASFHLFDPMVEAYFYEDPAALRAAQGTRARPARRVPNRDVERFEVDAALEPAYLGPVGECVRHHRNKERKCPWGGQRREEHPKKYLKYLCREDPPYEFCSTYKETHGGVAALAALDWNRVLASPGSAPFLRALVEDLEDALGAAPAISGWPATPTSSAPTARSKAPANRVLRNL